jgi:hypothetical protein
MKSHTPGPWFVVPDPQWEGKHPNHASRCICNVPQFAEVHPPTEGENGEWHVFHDQHGKTVCLMTDTLEITANARLIASAPEMLEIIRALLPHASNEWERLDDLVHRGSRESENAATELDNLIDRAREIVDKIGGNL